MVRSKPARRGSYKRTGRFYTGDFIAWDGEGVTDSKGKHRYIIFAASTGDYIISKDGPTPEGLSTTDCLDLLLEVTSSNPGTYNVIYGGSYDCNKILKDLIYSPTRLKKLWENSQCFYKNYHIEWVKGKWLKVHDMSTGRRATLYDVISFFQMSFVQTLQKWDIHVDHMDNIKNMKQQRNVFKWEDRLEQLAYCQQELTALVSLMEKFRDNHLAAGLPALSGLYGPGAIANGLLKRHNIKTHMIATDQEVNLAARYAYAAGRIERLRYGNYEGPVRIYDINSAYPYSISKLPSLAGGFRHYRGNADPETMSLYHVRLYNHDKYTSPLFYRKGLAKSRPIFFPNPKDNRYIETWIWTPEYETLVDLQISHLCLEAFIFNGDRTSKPFSWVQDMYYQRAAWKQEGNPAEKNLKLALNSLYGKFVQQAGYERQQQIPKFHQLEWGGYVTSETRAKIYRAIDSVGFAGVVGMETDSVIIAGNRQPQITLSDNLGDWGVTDYSGITYVQSGVYWLKTQDGWLDKYSKRRGYLPGTLTRDAVLNAWNNNPMGDDSIFEIQDYMTVKAEGQTFITLGHCFRPGQNFDRWGDWERGPKKLSLWKTNKRFITRGRNPAEHLLDTEDRTDFEGWSSPYDLVWGDKEGID